MKQSTEKLTFPPGTRAFLIVGHALEPRIKDGDLLFISPLAGELASHEESDYLTHDENGLLRIVGKLHGALRDA